jgi:nucleoside-diphosphate-sugar epimerase
MMFDVGIIGSTGSISRSIQTRLQERGLRAVVFGSSVHSRSEGDILYRQLDLHSMVDAEPRVSGAVEKVGTVIFLSTQYGRFATGSTERARQGEVCAPDFTRLFELLRIQPSRLVTFGSSEEYGARSTSEAISEDDEVAPLSSYGYWKAELRKNALLWAQGAPTTVHLRPFVVYGRNQKKDMFLGSVIEALREGRRFVMTAGEQWRSYVHTETVSDVVMRLIELPSWQFSVLNVSDDNYVQIREVAETVRKHIGRGTLEIGALSYRPEEVWHQKPDLARLHSLMAGTPGRNFWEELEKLCS